MSEYRSYMHIERLGNKEVEGILNGTVYVRPKVDGTNTCLFYQDGQVKCGSRKREISIDNDNQGCAKWVEENKEKFEKYFSKHPEHVLYGEFLVKHSIKYYNEDAWRKVYVFDVYDNIKDRWLRYEEYKNELEACGILVVPVLAVLNSPTIEQLEKLVQENHYLVPEDMVGEGCVLNNFDFVNKYGRTVWAKIVSAEFKHTKYIPVKTDDGQAPIEQKIIEDFLDAGFIEKEKAKIEGFIKDNKFKNS